MAITLSPLVPPDTGESPTLGASRIRGVAAALLQLLGETGLTSVTYTTAPISSVDHATGAMTLAVDGTTGKNPVAFDQFTTGSANGGTWFKLPGGLIVQFMLSVAIASSGSSVTLPTTFTSNTTYVALLNNITNNVAAFATNSTGAALTVNYTGGGAITINLIAVGS